MRLLKRLLRRATPTQSASTMLEKIHSLDQARQDAALAVEDIAGQIAALKIRIETAAQRSAELRANDAGDLEAVARELAEQTAIVEIGKGRLSRLQATLVGAESASTAARSALSGAIYEALEALYQFRLHQRRETLAKQLCEWISVKSTATVGPALTILVHRLALHDRSLDSVSEMSKQRGSETDFSCERSVRRPQPETDIPWFDTIPEEINQAVEWWQERTQEKDAYYAAISPQATRIVSWSPSMGIEVKAV